MSASEPTDALQPFKIMVVDDDPMVLKYVALALKGKGYPVESFNTPKGVLDVMRQGAQPDLILSDMYMPEMTGLELLKTLRETQQETPLIIMTSSRELDITVQAINQGASGFLLKPVVLEELHWMIERLRRERDLKERLTQEEAKLTHAQRLAELGILSTGIAHEINNPNCFIRGNVDLLAKLWGHVEPLLSATDGADRKVTLARQEIPQILQGIRDGSDRITRIVKSLSLYSRQEAKTALDASLREGVEEARNILVNRMDGVKVEWVDEAPQIQRVAAGEVQWVQILINLLANAADALKNTPQPQIRLEVHPEGNQQVRLDVIDNGPGIPPEHLPKLITPFFTTKRQGEGTGLGLYITHQLVTRLGGELTFANRPQGGACFTVILPVATEPRA